jgi:short subunit dehydrogenase-like uncharacterized protein
VPIAAGSLERRFDYGSGPAASVAVSWGDLSSAFVTTGIPNIETYFEATPVVRAMVASCRFLGPALAMAPWQELLRGLASSLPSGPTAAERHARSAIIVAEADHPSGRTVRSRLVTPEAYSLSAVTAAAVSAEVLGGNFEPGYQTPAALYGARYILGFRGVWLEDLPAERAAAS